MGQPNDRRSYLWTWAMAGATCLAAGAVWAAGVVYVGEGNRSEDAFLGVTLTEEIDNSEGGAKVLSVIEGSPAEEAGIEEGDIIQGIDGVVIRGPGALSRRLGEMEPGEQVSIRLLRDGLELTIDVELGEPSDGVHWYTARGAAPLQTETWSKLAEKFGEDFGEEFSERWTVWADELEDSIQVMPHHGGTHAYFFSASGRPKLGVQLSETTPELREHFGGNSETGVLISKILPDMPAADAGLRVGDLIVAIDGESVATSGEIVDELRDKDGETFEVDVIREGRPVSVEVTIPEREERSHGDGPRAYFMRVPAPQAAPTYPARPARSLPNLLEPPEPPAPPEFPAVPGSPAPPAPVSSGVRGMEVV